MASKAHHAEGAAPVTGSPGSALGALGGLVTGGEAARTVRSDELAQTASRAGAETLFATGAHGAATALLVRKLLRRSDRPVVVVAASAEQASRIAGDIDFVLGADPASAARAPSAQPSAEPEADAATDAATSGGAAARGELRLIVGEEASPYADVLPDRRAAHHRLAAALELARGRPPRVLVATASALVRKTLGPDDVRASAVKLRLGDEIDRDGLCRTLETMGYHRAPIVEDPACFAARGALVDVWPAGAAAPVRVELYGDMVLEMRAFDPEDQRSRQATSELWLPPADEMIRSPERLGRAEEKLRELGDAVSWPSSRTRQLIEDLSLGRGFFGAAGYAPAFGELEPLFAVLPEDAIVVLEEPEAIAHAVGEELARAEHDRQHHARLPHFPVAAFYANQDELARFLARATVVALAKSALGLAGGTDGPLDAFARRDEATPSLLTRDQTELARALTNARAAAGHAASLDPLADRIRGWLDAGLRVVLAARTSAQAERLGMLLGHRDLSARVELEGFDASALFELETTGRTEDAALWVVRGPLARGVIAPLEGLVLVTEEEIFGTRAHRARAKKRKPSGAMLDDLRALALGDFVVHVEHGVGRYRGLAHRQHGGHMLDLIAVEYEGGDKLYLPVYRLNQIQKFHGGDADPKLDRLGGQTFAKRKARAEGSVRQLADELLRLYAAREAAVGEATPPVDDSYSAFEASFPYEETEDQARAIADVGADLESSSVMDRLVCGDVGFGKTEVALRAAFRVAMSGRQVAVLCPTTVLAQQHTATFEARLADYPITIASLSRFADKRALEGAVRGLRDGSIDIAIGTHRLLSKDVHFKQLGLLVIDEEQRFGVAHKERIKALKTHVDVLTLTATPIPRTLQMAVSGLRELSIISTPPADRRAVRTVVSRFDEMVVREALERELGRGGQAFWVCNRIAALGERAAELARILPRARIAVAHGQLSERELERTMLDFVAGRYDVLCATAIIENGLDIPRCNTIFIDRPELFGLAQLYQLRGRVGRSKERAHCYLVLSNAPLSDEARMRIEALERYSDLGAGFQVASLDLDLRGAGDLLGPEQSGTLASIGFEMFCDLLAEAVAEARGEPVAHEVDPELSFDAEAYVPEAYVPDVGVRLSLYKRLAGASHGDDVDDVGREMEDRFGTPPAEARAYLRMMRIKTELRSFKVLGCEAGPKAVTLHLRNDTPLDSRKLAALLGKRGSAYKLTPDMRLSRKSAPGEACASGLDAAERMLDELTRALA